MCTYVRGIASRKTRVLFVPLLPSIHVVHCVCEYTYKFRGRCCSPHSTSYLRGWRGFSVRGISGVQAADINCLLLRYVQTIEGVTVLHTITMMLRSVKPGGVLRFVYVCVLVNFPFRVLQDCCCARGSGSLTNAPGIGLKFCTIPTRPVQLFIIASSSVIRTTNCKLIKRTCVNCVYDPDLYYMDSTRACFVF